MDISKKNDTKFTKKDVELVAKKTLFDGFFKMVKYTFKHKLFKGGWSNLIEREVFLRSDAVAILPYDPKTDQIVIIEQVRVGALDSEFPWQYEIIAGMKDTDETSEEVVRREAQEEAGIQLKRIAQLFSYYPSVGSCSEKLELFIGEVDSSNVGGIYGLDSEDEDIRVFVLDRKIANRWLQEGKFQNSAALIALQWLSLHHKQLQMLWLKSEQ